MNELTQDLRDASRELNAQSYEGVFATPWETEPTTDATEDDRKRLDIITAKKIGIGKLNKEKNFHIYTSEIILDAVNGEKRPRRHLNEIPTEILGTWVYRQVSTKIKQFAIVDEGSGRTILAFDWALSCRLLPDLAKQHPEPVDKLERLLAAQEKFALALIVKCNQKLEQYRQGNYLVKAPVQPEQQSAQLLLFPRQQLS